MTETSLTDTNANAHKLDEAKFDFSSQQPSISQLYKVINDLCGQLPHEELRPDFASFKTLEEVDRWSIIQLAHLVKMFLEDFRRWQYKFMDLEKEFREFQKASS